MRSVKMLGLFAAVMVCSVMISLAGGAKSYQVTGKVTEVSDSVIIVEKADGEKWEVSRSADTKNEGTPKVGDKVTIMYTMTAKTITVKGGDPISEKKEEKPAKKSKK